MQLILETENPSIGLKKETMTTLEEDIVALKNNTNDVNTNVLNGNKENFQDVENVEESRTCSDEENKNSEMNIASPVSNNHNDESTKNEDTVMLEAAKNDEKTSEFNNIDSNGPEQSQSLCNGSNVPEDVHLVTDKDDVIDSKAVTADLLNESSAVDNSEPSDIVNNDKEIESLDNKIENIEENTNPPEFNNDMEIESLNNKIENIEENTNPPEFNNDMEIESLDNKIENIEEITNPPEFNNDKEIESLDSKIENIEENTNPPEFNKDKEIESLDNKIESIEENTNPSGFNDDPDTNSQHCVDNSDVAYTNETNSIDSNVQEVRFTEENETKDVGLQDNNVSVTDVELASESLERQENIDDSGKTEIKESIPKSDGVEKLEVADTIKQDISINEEDIKNSVEESIPKSDAVEKLEVVDNIKQDISINEEDIKDSVVSPTSGKNKIMTQSAEVENNSTIEVMECENSIASADITKIDCQLQNLLDNVNTSTSPVSDCEEKAKEEVKDTKTAPDLKSSSEILIDSVMDTKEQLSNETSMSAETPMELEETTSAKSNESDSIKDDKNEEAETPMELEETTNSISNEPDLIKADKSGETNLPEIDCTTNESTNERSELSQNMEETPMELEEATNSISNKSVLIKDDKSGETNLPEIDCTTNESTNERSELSQNMEETPMELEAATNSISNKSVLIKDDNSEKANVPEIDCTTNESTNERSELPENMVVSENNQFDVDIVNGESKREPAVSPTPEENKIVTESADAENNSAIAVMKCENSVATSDITNIECQSQKSSDNINTSTPATDCKMVEDKAKEEVKDVKTQDQTASDSFEKTNEDEVFVIDDEKVDSAKEDVSEEIKSPIKVIEVVPLKMKLSNTLNILSDDEDELPVFENKTVADKSKIPTKENHNPAIDTPENKVTENKNKEIDSDKNCINLDDDDDIMLIDEEPTPNETNIKKPVDDNEIKVNSENLQNQVEELPITTEEVKEPEGKSEPVVEIPAAPTLEIPEKVAPKESATEAETKKIEKRTPLLPESLFKNYRKNLADMTRDELEEFCILKIVESIIDRSDLNEIRTKLKTMAQNIEEYKKKAMLLMKQNRDLKLVLTSVQEEQKKGGDSPITPLKITRSVGMQVLMTDKVVRKKGPSGPSSAGPNSRSAKSANQKPQAQTNNNITPIPVPRLVPAQTNVAVTRNPVVNQSPVKPQQPKPSSPMPNGVKNSPPPGKAEKRPHNKMLTVDLTDDEPPCKVPAKLPSSPPVRLVPPQNLMAPRMQMAHNSPRKVYIPIGTGGASNVPINTAQAPTIRPGTLMLKAVQGPGPRNRGPVGPMVRIPQNSVRMGRVHNGRHPAPLPDVVKQYQSPNWKALPPAPDLKLSKVENGIVISWKIEGYQEDSYEEIASYQLYAYQETSAPPNTSLWKKIGDVKALPLPMACTLTQFMAGYKYYFAVRAVDVKSRLGPFSLPGSILLLNKM